MREQAIQKEELELMKSIHGYVEGIIYPIIVNQHMTQCR